MHNCLCHKDPFSSCYSRITASAYDKTLRTWDLETGKLLVSMLRPSGDASARGLHWALGGPGLGVGWQEKSDFQEKRIFSGTQDDEVGALREGLLLEGWIHGKKWDGVGVKVRGHGISD